MCSLCSSYYHVINSFDDIIYSALMIQRKVNFTLHKTLVNKFNVEHKIQRGNQINRQNVKLSV